MGGRRVGNLGSLGFSIIEILIASGIVSIVALATVSIITSQRAEMTRLQAAAASIDVQSSVAGVLRTTGGCTFNLGPPGTTFNASGIPTSGAPLGTNPKTYNQIYDGADNTKPILVSVSAMLGQIPGVTVASIVLTDWLSIGVDEFRASLVISYNLPNGIGVRPIRIEGIKILTDPASPVNAKTMSVCSLSNLPGGGSSGQFFPVSSMPGMVITDRSAAGTNKRWGCCSPTGCA